MKGSQRNYAFIDGQNLHLGTVQDGWHTDHKRMRVYLRDKYEVGRAFYFFGYYTPTQAMLYTNLRDAGFDVIFKEHVYDQLAKKKGNVDTDIVFAIMSTIIDDSNFDSVVLVSGDGDYKKLVQYLIKKERFKKILFPNKRFASSLYKDLGSEYFDYLIHAREKIGYKKEKGS